MKKNNDNQIAFYQSADGGVNVEVLYAHENIWLSQKKMSELFGCTTDNISLHSRYSDALHRSSSDRSVILPTW